MGWEGARAHTHKHTSALPIFLSLSYIYKLFVLHTAACQNTFSTSPQTKQGLASVSCSISAHNISKTVLKTFFFLLQNESARFLHFYSPIQPCFFFVYCFRNPGEQRVTECKQINSTRVHVERVVYTNAAFAGNVKDPRSRRWRPV